jgi:hypothetical protein
MNSLRQWLLVFALIAVPFAATSAIGADEPILLSEHREGVAALHWSATNGQLHVGTIGGNLVTLVLRSEGDRLKVVESSDPYRIDRLAVLTLQGDGLNLVAGGMGISPQTRIFRGGRAGRLDLVEADERPLQICTDYDGTKTRFAILYPSRLVIREGAALARQMSIDGRFRSICWAPKSGAPSVLVGHDTGRLLVWKSADATPEPFELPVDSLTSLTGVGGASGEIVAIESGRLRFWNPRPSPSTTTPLPAPENVTFTENAELILEQFNQLGQMANLLRLRTPLQATPVKVFSTAPRTANGIAVASKGGKTWAVAALRKTSIAAGEIRVYDTDNEVVTLGSNPPPTDDLSVVASSPSDSGKKAAGLERGKGVLFFEQPAPDRHQPAPVAGFMEDRFIGAMKHSTEGRWLFTVGSALSLYDAKKRQLVGQKALPAIPASDGKPSAWWIRPFGDSPAADAPPSSGRVILGTDKGRLCVIDFRVSQGTGKWELTALLTTTLKLADNAAITAIAARDTGLLATTATRVYSCRLPTADMTSETFVLLERVDAPGALAVALDGERNILIRLRDNERKVSPVATGVFDGVGNFASVAPNPAGDRAITASASPEAVMPTMWKLLNHALVEPISLEGGGKGKATRFLWEADGQSLVIGCEATPDDDLRELTWFDLPSMSGVPANIRLRFAPSHVDFGSLCWYTPSSGESPDSRRLLYLEGVGTDAAVELRTLDKLVGPGVAKLSPPKGSPWYAAALKPDASELVLVNGAGEAWQVSAPFSPRLAGLNSPFEGLKAEKVILPTSPDNYSPPLYGAVWNRVRVGPDMHDALYLGDAHGTIRRRLKSEWIAKTPFVGVAVSCLGADAKHAAIVVGHGSGIVGPPPVFLTVWSSDLASHRPISGHLAPVVGAAFSRTHDGLATVDNSGSMRLWKVVPATSGPIDLEAVDSIQIPIPDRSTSAGSQSPRDAPMSLTWVESDNRRFAIVGISNGSIWSKFWQP